MVENSSMGYYESFQNLKPDNIHHWQAILVSRPCKAKIVVFWSSPPDDFIKFNVDGVTRGKPCPTGVDGVLWNSKGKMLFMFSKNVGMIMKHKSQLSQKIFEFARLHFTRSLSFKMILLMLFLVHSL